MTETDQAEAMKALQAWFMSQDIDSPDAGVIMISMIARLLVYRTKDLNELAKSIQIHAEFLAVEVAGELRKSNVK